MLIKSGPPLRFAGVRGHVHEQHWLIIGGIDRCKVKVAGREARLCLGLVGPFLQKELSRQVALQDLAAVAAGVVGHVLEGDDTLCGARAYRAPDEAGVGAGGEQDDRRVSLVQSV